MLKAKYSKLNQTICDVCRRTVEREPAGDSGATNTSSSHHKDPGDGTAQVEQRRRKGRQEKDDVPPPSPIQHALGQVSYCTSHDTPQYKDICLLYSFIKLFINLEDWLEYNLRESHCFFDFHRWFQRFCSPQEIPVLHRGPLFCLILCLALLPHLHRPQFLQAMRSSQWSSFHSCCKGLKVSSKHQGAAPLAPWFIGGNIF